MDITPRDHLALVRRACKLIDDVRDGEPDRLTGPLAASILTDDPIVTAHLLLILAACADIERATPGDVYERLDQLGSDLGEFPKYAHTIYAQYTSRKASHQVPGWVTVGERVYSRLKARRQRSARKAAA